MFYWHGRRSRKKGREGTGRIENYRQTSSSIYIDSCVQRLMGFRGRLRIMQGSRLTRANLSSVKPNVCSLWRAKRGPSSSQLDPFRSRGSIWMSDVRVSLRRFHRRRNNSFHPFGNAYKSCDSVATETATECDEKVR